MSVLRLVVSMAAVLPLAACAVAPAEPPRNLLLVTLDTLRADHLGAYGYDRPTSPNLDALAARSVVFEDATCSMPTTLPSHVSILTGLRPRQHGVRANGQVPPSDLETVFDLLRRQGSSTAAVVGAQVVGERYLDGLGFDTVIFPGGARRYQVGGERVTRHALEWLAGRRADPFALWVHYYDTHEPYTPPPEVLARFARPYDGRLPDHLSVRQLVELNEPSRRAELEPADLDHLSDLYDAEIAHLDAQLGLLLATLEEWELLEDTLVVIVGDHGQALGERGFFGHGLRLLEPVVQVPLIVRPPGMAAPRRVTTPVETVDLLPTLIDYFALPAPGVLPGRSLRPAIEGGELPPPRFRVVERRQYEEQPEVVGLALHGGDWKAVFYRDEDGSETRALARGEDLDGAGPLDPETPQARWMAAILAELETADVAPSTPLDDEERRMLRSLGYLD